MEQFELDETEDGYRLTLAPVLDMSNSKPLRAFFLSLSSLGKKIVIDAAHVQRMSTPCVQVFLAAAQSFEENDVEFSLSQPTATFINAFDDLGLFSTLLKWNVET